MVGRAKSLTLFATVLALCVGVGLLEAQYQLSGAHKLLSVFHSDVTVGTVARGDVLTGQGATATWTRLPIGAADQVLISDGTDLAWGDIESGEHELVGVLHTATGLTIGHVVRATGATTFAWEQLGFSDLGGTPTTLAGYGITDAASDAELAAHAALTDAHSATALNTASRIVLRDGAGDFAAGSITADLIGDVTGDVSGNADTVTDGVYTTGSYADPAWITSLAGTKITGAASIAWSIVAKTGSSLADLATRSAGDLNSGTLLDARLSGNVPLLDAAINAFTGAVSFGSNPASSGRIRLPNNNAIRFRNTANDSDIDAVSVNTSDQLVLGAEGVPTVIAGALIDTLTVQKAHGTYFFRGFNTTNGVNVIGFYGDGTAGVVEASGGPLKLQGSSGLGLTIDAGNLAQVAVGMNFSAAESNTPKVKFTNSHGATAHAAVSTYDDANDTYLLSGSNIYLNSAGSFTRFNTSRASSGIQYEPGLIAFLVGDASTTPSQKMSLSVTGLLSVAGALKVQGRIAPTTLAAGNNNDWAPTDFASATLVQITGDAGGTSRITGIAGGAAGRIIYIRNIGAPIFEMSTEDTNSAAANRIATMEDTGGGGVSLLVLGTGEAATLIYDGTLSRWVVVSNLT